MAEAQPLHALVPKLREVVVETAAALDGIILDEEIAADALDTSADLEVLAGQTDLLVEILCEPRHKHLPCLKFFIFELEHHRHARFGAQQP